MSCERLHNEIRQIPGAYYENGSYLAKPEVVTDAPAIEISFLSVKKEFEDLPEGTYIGTNVLYEHYKESPYKIGSLIIFHAKQRLIHKKPCPLIEEKFPDIDIVNAFLIRPFCNNKDGTLMFQIEMPLSSDIEKELIGHVPENYQRSEN